MSLAESEVSHNTSKHGQVRQLLLASVLDSVKQCQRHFGAGQGVATDLDPRVVNLLNSLDACLSHGVRLKAGKIVKKVLAGGRREETGAFWPAVKEVLSEFQYQRLVSSYTDQGTDLSKTNLGLGWLKDSLNERNLDTVLSTLLAENAILAKYYEEHAFIRDDEKSSVLPTSAAGLNSVIFALRVSTDSRNPSPRPEERRSSPALKHLGTEEFVAFDQSMIVSGSDRLITYSTDPLTQSEKISSYNSTSAQPANFLQGDFTPEPVMNVAAQGLVRKDSKNRRRGHNQVRHGKRNSSASEIIVRHKQKVGEWSETLAADASNSSLVENIFEHTFSGSENGTDLSNQGIDMDGRSSQLSSSDTEERNGNHTLLVGELSSTPDKYSLSPERAYIPAQMHGSQLGLLPHESTNQLNAFAQEALNATAIALDASSYGNNVGVREESHLLPNQSLSEMSRHDLETLMFTLSKQNETLSDKNKHIKIELEREQRANVLLRDEIELEKSEMKRERDELTMKVVSFSRENELLKGQLKKYVGMVQSMEIRESMGISQKTPTSPPTTSEASEDNEKIVQLSDMYGELMELNDRLHRELVTKDNFIHRLRSSLTSLGLDVPCIQTAVCTQEEGSEFSGDGILKQEIVKIWIPSAFLREESYHVYQIYIRIHNDEWNVYRRYTEFNDFHHQLCKKISSMEKFYFPPKKNLGRKDAKFVEERRQKLQSYLRYMVHVLSQPLPQDKPALLTENLTKRKFLEMLPFFGDIQQPVGNRSRTSSPSPYMGRRGSNQQQQQQQQQQQRRSPTYKGL